LPQHPGEARGTPPPTDTAVSKHNAQTFWLLSAILKIMNSNIIMNIDF